MQIFFGSSGLFVINYDSNPLDTYNPSSYTPTAQKSIRKAGKPLGEHVNGKFYCGIKTGRRA